MFIKKQKAKKAGKPRQIMQKTQRVNGGSTGAVFAHPPMLKVYPIVHRCRMRFIVTSVLAGQNISWNNLIDTIGVLASATAFYNLFREVKVNEIEMWDIASTQGGVSTLGVLWNENDSNQAGDGRLVTDMSLGVVPAHIRTGPSKDGISSKWHVGFGPNTVNAFSLTASGGCVIDVDLSFRGSAAGQANGANAAAVGGVVGATAWRGLDGLPVLTTKFIANGPVYQV